MKDEKPRHDVDFSEYNKEGWIYLGLLSFHKGCIKGVYNWGQVREGMIRTWRKGLRW